MPWQNATGWKVAKCHRVKASWQQIVTMQSSYRFRCLSNWKKHCKVSLNTQSYQNPTKSKQNFFRHAIHAESLTEPNQKTWQLLRIVQKQFCCIQKRNHRERETYQKPHLQHAESMPNLSETCLNNIKIHENHSFEYNQVEPEIWQTGDRNLPETTPPRCRIHAEAFAATDACQAVRSISTRKATEAQQRYTEWQPFGSEITSEVK